MANGDDMEVVHWVGINKQLEDLGKQFSKVGENVNLLTRQVENVAYRVGQLEQKPSEQRSAWTFGLNSCQTVIYLASAATSGLAALMSVAAVIVAIIALHH